MNIFSCSVLQDEDKMEVLLEILYGLVKGLHKRVCFER